MTGFQNNAQAYVESFGTKQTGNSVVLQRAPSSNDVNYPIGTLWIDQKDAQTYYLLSQSNASGQLQSTWELISKSSVLVTLSDTANTPVSPSSSIATPPNNIQLQEGAGISIVSDAANNKIVITNTGTSSTETITGDDGTAVSPSGGTILLKGKVVNNGTHPTKAVYTETSGASNQENIDVQVTTTIAAADVTKVGLAAFNSAQFTVDGTNAGFISLKGGSTPPALTLTTQDSTAVGPTAGGTINVVGAGSITTTGNSGTNTATVQLTGLTNHNVLVGAGTTTITKVAPSATSGVPLVSTGAASDPSFGTAVVAGGGTGNTTFTAYAPILAGTTATGAFQQATTNFSTSGYVLTSNGSSAVPSWQAASASGSVTGLKSNDGTTVAPSAGVINVYGDTTTLYTSGSGSTLTAKVAMITNGMLYGAGATTSASVLSPSNNSVMTSSAAGVPQWTSLATNGQVIIGSSSGAPAAANITGAGGITVTNGANSIQISNTNGAPVSSFTLDAATTPISPSSGVITLTGGQVATGTVGANVIRTRGNTASSCTIEIQRSTSSASANSNLNGVCHFDSSKFSVDTNGFVTFTGSTSNIPWTNQSGNFSASSNQGYFCNAALTMNLPATPSRGDVIRIVVDTSSAVIIAPAATQKLRIGNTITTIVTGTATSNKQGDSLDLVYNDSSAVWYSVGGSEGTWTLT